jgi:hypothetical protein
MSTPDVGRARTHKVLHHKRPALFPLLDRHTADVLRPAGQPLGWNAWQVIRADIDGSGVGFEELRAWFAGQAVARDGVALELPRSSVPRLRRPRTRGRRCHPDPGPSGTGTEPGGAVTANAQVKEIRVGESACRPGSVRPLARGGGHPSGTAVADSLVRSTREHRAGRPRSLAQGTLRFPS